MLRNTLLRMLPTSGKKTCLAGWIRYGPFLKLRLWLFPYAFNTTLQTFPSSWQWLWVVRCSRSSVLSPAMKWMALSLSFYTQGRNPWLIHLTGGGFGMACSPHRLGSHSWVDGSFFCARTHSGQSFHLCCRSCEMSRGVCTCSSIGLNKALYVDVFVHTLAHACFSSRESVRCQMLSPWSSFLDFSLWHFP